MYISLICYPHSDICVGSKWRFGKGGEGNAETIHHYAEVHEFVVDGHSTRDLVCVLTEQDDEEYLEDCIKSREDWLKYRKKQLEKFNAR